MRLRRSPEPWRRSSLWRALCGSGLALLLALFGACAQRAPRATAAPYAPPLSEAHARQIVGEWQRQLGDYIDQVGDGDPAVLARLSAQRATGTLRPSRIVFGALDVESRVAEDDGFDVQGLLLSPLPEAGPQPYVFVVAIVHRQGFRPLDLVDIRLVSMNMRGRQREWALGNGDAQALASYRGAIDPTVPLRFPADKDRFELQPCVPHICADELSTAARWSFSAGGAAPSGTLR